MKNIKHVLTMALGATALMSAAATVHATNGKPINTGSAEKYTVSVIGDMPYGDEKVAAFPQFIDFLNTDPKVDIVVHLGDIKSGSSVCSDEYFRFVRDEFDRLKDPLVYTPGDNEWTDCHRINNDGYLPTERLEKVREIFFSVPGETIGGRKKQVLTQSDDPEFSDFVENVMWMESKVVFATLNVPGSNDDNWETNPWFKQQNMPDLYKATQLEEQASRDAANADWLAKTFETATANRALGVVLMLQADMWDGTATLDAYPPIVAAIGNAALAFGKPVLLLVGDSHIYTVDNPYDPVHFPTLFAIHPGTPSVPNITRVIVQGSTTAPNEFEYLRLTIDPRSPDLFSWDRVRFKIH